MKQQNANESRGYRHTCHMMPPRGWMNDPNGFVCYRGQYHLFYQHNPYAPEFGLIHWGHCVSNDLIRWTPLPAALAPDRPYDASGCFSGSAIEHDGKLYVFYTGNAPDGRQTQCLAVSADGVHFSKHEANPVIASPPASIKPNQFRDPCVFRLENRFFMLVGAEGKNGRGQALVYVSDNLLDWAYLHAISAETDAMGNMWECPNLIFVDGRAVLLLSPQGMAGNPPFNPKGDTGYFVGRFDPATGAYTHGAFHKLDFGFDLYATQTTADASGRALLSAWMSTWETPAPTAAHGWAGSLILPREMHVQGDALVFQPARELARYQTPVTTVTDVPCAALPPLRGKACRLAVLAEPRDFCIQLFRKANGQSYTALRYDAQTHTLTLDLSHSGACARGVRRLTLPKAPDALALDIYLDHSSVEIFVQNGACVMTARVFPTPEADEITLSGDAFLRRLSLWKIDVPASPGEV